MSIKFLTVKNSVLGDYSVQSNQKAIDPLKDAHETIESEIYSLEATELLTYNNESSDGLSEAFIGSVVYTHRGKTITIDIDDTPLDQEKEAISLGRIKLIESYKKGLPKKECPLSKVLNISIEELFGEKE